MMNTIANAYNRYALIVAHQHKLFTLFSPVRLNHFNEIVKKSWNPIWNYMTHIEKKVS